MTVSVKTEIESLEAQIHTLEKDATAWALGSTQAIRDGCERLGQTDTAAIFSRLEGALALHALANGWVSLPKQAVN